MKQCMLVSVSDTFATIGIKLVLSTLRILVYRPMENRILFSSSCSSNNQPCAPSLVKNLDGDLETGAYVSEGIYERAALLCEIPGSLASALQFVHI